MNITDDLVWNLVLNVISNSNLFKQSIKDEMLDKTSIVETKTDVKKIEKKSKLNDKLIQKINQSIVNQETDKLIGIRSEKEIEMVLEKLDHELLKLKSKKEEYQSEISNRNQKSNWVDRSEGRRLTDDPTNKAMVDIIVPLKRAGNSKDIAYTALFLCSDEAKYITGQSLILDGGSTLGAQFEVARAAYKKIQS